jgi:hypothetical protein
MNHRKFVTTELYGMKRHYRIVISFFEKWINPIIIGRIAHVKNRKYNQIIIEIQ